MPVTVVKAEQLNLPEQFAKKLKGYNIEFVETSEGLLLKPVMDPIKELRGYMEGSKFTTEEFQKQKQLEKELDKIPFLMELPRQSKE